VRALTADEQGLLPDLVRARLAQRLLLNCWLAAADPGNAAYTLRSVDRATRSLAGLAAAAPPAGVPGGA
jgi:Ser/Thr protein kinase RdoA (MazF antagonist)